MFRDSFSLHLRHWSEGVTLEEGDGYERPVDYHGHDEDEHQAYLWRRKFDKTFANLNFQTKSTNFRNISKIQKSFFWNI